jgi:hypothetical protein
MCHIERLSNDKEITPCNITLDHSSKSASLTLASPMKRFWQILTLILLALMVPASVCCLETERAEGHACECRSTPGHEHDAPAPPEACPSDTIAHSQVPALVAVPAMQMLELADIIHAMLRLNELAATNAAPVPLMTTAPPELRTTWVFVSRAALPARAPAELA